MAAQLHPKAPAKSVLRLLVSAGTVRAARGARAIAAPVGTARGRAPTPATQTSIYWAARRRMRVRARDALTHTARAAPDARAPRALRELAQKMAPEVRARATNTCRAVSRQVRACALRARLPMAQDARVALAMSV